jgi:hypothetical protein
MGHKSFQIGSNSSFKSRTLHVGSSNYANTSGRPGRNAGAGARATALKWRIVEASFFFLLVAAVTFEVLSRFQ